MLEEALNSAEVAVCIKDANRAVLLQNDRCRRICGDRGGAVCEDGCMAMHREDDSLQWPDWGTTVHRNAELDGGHYDITLICSSERVITLLQPLDSKYDEALAYYRAQDLTPRELEVVSLLLRGRSNTEITGELGISHATLRTHLNRVYSKLRDQGIATEFLPRRRTGASAG
ncbi:MAG TPA: LuxR C-terminal-related transcriptional regulator [Pseudohaliea sp.]|nr:LuxR C-terminal-related transcriptional regulator [Pseudohaliea sp.]HKL61811.1 LuxR C-terminal-related transcriptional regulator [Woeseiaceae bacterium]